MGQARNRVREALSQIFLLLFAIPSIGVVTIPSSLFNDWGWIVALLGGLGYIILAHNPNWDTFEKPHLPTKNLSEKDVDVLLKEYEELGEDFRYKDLLMTRSIYLSLAISGVLATVITQTEEGRAFVAMIGSLIAFGFVVSITSQKGSRDQISDRRLELENHPSFQNKLTGLKSGTIRERPFFSNFSASGFIRRLHLFTLILWVSTYLYLVSWLYNMS